MFNGQLPKHISPRKLAYQSAELQGVLPVASCPRLKDMLADDRAEISVNLRFEVDEQRRPLVTGELEATLSMVCQRCLDVAEIQFVACVNMAVVRNDEQARNLPANLDPLFVEDEAVELLPLLEEEVILNMPAFAYHENDTCHSNQETYSTLPEGGADELDVEDVQRPNPFSVLAGLKTGK
ncbi:YceD family protein [Sansalvadorimonas verongulae]|uniref:YceD family protein n=1 Tax=Sansalvadorimonas verongulae TaxID=2172824 RepID=UPI0012BB6375|nr:YceD family protein [Sansalvadorimonas verongulae]MTI14670.1 hypothetical protein [Sansalvadorimonas verongulae]